MPAEELIERCVDLQIAGLVVTDHHYQWPQGELDALAQSIAGNGLVVLSAYEVTTLDPKTDTHAGDILVYDWPEDEPPLPIWTPYEEACARIREIGALGISAHPYREGMGAGDLVYEMDIDGIEIFNQNHAQAHVNQARAAVARRGFLGVAGSDAHHRMQVGQFYTVFEQPVQTIAEFVTELRERRFVIQSNRPDIS